MKIYKIENKDLYIAPYKGKYITSYTRNLAIYWGLLQLVFNK